MDDLLLHLLDKHPYFSSSTDAFGALLNSIIAKGQSHGEAALKLNAGYLYFYGDQSRFNIVETVSDTFGSLKNSRENSFNAKMIEVEGNSLISYVHKNKTPVFVRITRSNGILAHHAFSSLNASDTDLQPLINLKLNATLLEALSALNDRTTPIPCNLLCIAPLGTLSAKGTIPSEHAFQVVQRGVMTGYAVLFMNSAISKDQVSEDELKLFEIVMKSLWMVGNSDERFHLFRYERSARDDFMSDLIHRFAQISNEYDRSIDFLQKINQLWIKFPEELTRLLIKKPDYINQNRLKLAVDTFKTIRSGNQFELVKLEDQITKWAVTRSVEISGSSSAMIFVNTGELFFVFEELFNNALKNKLKLSSPKIELLDQLDAVSTKHLIKYVGEDTQNFFEDFVAFSITNSGSGVQQEFREFIFLKGKTIEVSKDEKMNSKFKISEHNRNRGMGLYLVRKYIEEHFGGLVFEEGVVDQFARFYVILRRYRESHNNA